MSMTVCRRPWYKPYRITSPLTDLIYALIQNFLIFNKSTSFVEFGDRFRTQYFSLILISTNQYFSIDFLTSTNQQINIFQHIIIDFVALVTVPWYRPWVPNLA